MLVATARLSPTDDLIIISTHTTHVGGDFNLDLQVLSQLFISTHTTHVGGDGVVEVQMFRWVDISTHTTHVGGDENLKHLGYITYKFQLTPPMWVATSELLKLQEQQSHFNSHHPCGWRRFLTGVTPYYGLTFQLTPPMWVATTSVCLKVVFSKHISTHTTHVGGDRYLSNVWVRIKIFQLTPPMWVATAISDKNISETAYYIHRSLQKTSKRHQY
mgnify:CR=1 FL=1